MKAPSILCRVILCIDDDQDQLKLRALVLSGAGYTVLTATNAAAGLHLFMHNHVDLVVSDHLLPDAPGSDLIGEMKRLKPEVPFALLSGLPEAPQGAEQADLFLTKGMAVAEFLTGIAKLLGGKANSASNVSS